MSSLPGLNTRETALVGWLVLGLALGLVVAIAKPDIRSSLGGVLKAIFGSAWVTAFLIVTGLYVAGCVLLLKLVGYWEPGMTKRTILWFLGIGVVALFNTKHKDARHFLRLVLQSLSVPAVVEFLSNLHTFPIYVELLLIPLIVLSAAALPVAESDPHTQSAANAIGWLLALFTLTSLSFSLAHVATNFEHVATAEKVREFLLPFLLTACFIPFLYLVALFSVYQSMLAITRFGLNDDQRLYRVARRAIVRACGLSLARTQLFAERFRFRLWGLEDEADMTSVVDEFYESWDARRAA